MTQAERKIIGQSLKPLFENGLITPETYKAICTMDGTAPGPQWLSRAEAAKMLGICGKSLSNYEESGLLKGLRIAGKRLIRYKTDDIENLVNGGIANA